MSHYDTKKNIEYGFWNIISIAIINQQVFTNMKQIKLLSLYYPYHIEEDNLSTFFGMPYFHTVITQLLFAKL